MKKEKIKLPKVAELTGIPYDRLYQWVKGKSSPKTDDTKTLENFISGNFSNILQEGQPAYTPGSTIQPQQNCMEMLNKALEVIASQQKTIESLVNTQPGQLRGNAASA